MDNSAFTLPKAKKPEDAGVSGKVVLSFLEEMEKRGIEIHSFQVIRHGKLACECFRAPFTKDRPHAMYSISKTVTATAIGIAVREGLISVEDRVRDFFPEEAGNIKDERLDGLLIKHLLTMTSGKNPSVFADKTKGKWIEAFFSSPWYNTPGEEFKYVNENIYMLSAIIKRVTGECMRDYLAPRLFAPLGINYPFWETDENGIEAGGWGLYLRTEELSKIMLLYLNKGIIGDRRILDEEWTITASLPLADNSSEADSDAAAGYGYCLWRCAQFDGYRADGMFSQFGIVFSEYDAVLCVTSAEALAQSCRDFIWEYFPRAFSECNEEIPHIQDVLNNAVLEAPAKMTDSSAAEKIDGRVIHFRKKLFLNLIGFPMSMLPLAVTYMTTDRAGNIDNCIFNFGTRDFTFSWDEGDESNTIPVGLDGSYRYGTMTLGGIEYKVCCDGMWGSRNELIMNVRPIETIGKRSLDFTFRENGRVTMKPRSTPSVVTIAKNLAPGFEKMIGFKPLTDAIIPLFSFADKLLEPTHKGKVSRK